MRRNRRKEPALTLMILIKMTQLVSGAVYFSYILRVVYTVNNNGVHAVIIK